MRQTTTIECPYCNKIQNEDINDLAMDAGDMDGSFPHICDECEQAFVVEYSYKPFVRTSLDVIVDSKKSEPEIKGLHHAIVLVSDMKCQLANGKNEIAFGKEDIEELTDLIATIQNLIPMKEV